MTSAKSSLITVASARCGQPKCLLHAFASHQTIGSSAAKPLSRPQQNGPIGSAGADLPHDPLALFAAADTSNWRGANSDAVAQQSRSTLHSFPLVKLAGRCQSWRRLAPVIALLLAAQRLNLLNDGLGVGWRSRCGRDQRSSNPEMTTRRFRGQKSE